MHVTVAICTWNRAALLEQTLEGMAHLEVPEDVTWELLVVDNNSTDGTRGVVSAFSDRLPVRHLFEPTPGKSHALNLATHEASGEYILWTDDDVLVESSWLGAYVGSFRRHPNAGFFGGNIRPWFAQGPPEWLRRGFDLVSAAFATIDCGTEERRIVPEHVPFGANMAVRTSEQRAFAYDPALGPRPGSGMRGEETTLIRQMLAQGVEGWWVPDAIVQHHVPAERQSVEYLRSYFTGYGERLAPTHERWEVARLFGKPRWLWRSAIQNEVGFRVGRLLARPERWVANLRAASIAWGALGLSSLWKSRR